jgi:hypothetical protein
MVRKKNYFGQPDENHEEHTIAGNSADIQPANLTEMIGRAIAHAVSRWLPTSAARVRARACSSGICGGQSGAGAGFLRVLQFPLPTFIPPTSRSSQSPGAGTIGQKWPTCRVDPVWTVLTEMRLC